MFCFLVSTNKAIITEAVKRIEGILEKNCFDFCEMADQN